MSVVVDCPNANYCPPIETVTSEGAQQVVTARMHDAGGAETTTSVVLNVDTTAPTVTITTPSRAGVTTATSIRVVARVADALSGVVDATCNGRTTPVDDKGMVHCLVPLLPGVNDIVVEATDQADNSGSAGIRVTRTGTPSTLRIVPEALGLLLSSPRQLQVLNEFGEGVADVGWTVDNGLLGTMSDDGRGVFTATAPGVVRVTATHGDLSADAVITIYGGDRLPAGATRWRVPGLSVVETPDATPPPAASAGPSLLASERDAHKRATILSFNESTGWLNWSETPAVDDTEVVIGKYEHSIGGVLLVLDSADGTRSALVRGGRSGDGTPWRYRSAGRLRREIVQDRQGTIVAIETGPDDLPRLLVLDGRTGRVLLRAWLPSGRRVVRNVACVPEANAVREVPAVVGPPTSQGDGTLTFLMLRVDDLEDYRSCGQVEGRLRRVLELVTLTSDGPTAQLLRVYDVAASVAPATVTLFPVADDGQGGRLAPWLARFGEDQQTEARIMHFTSTGQQEYAFPTVGNIVVQDGTAAMTDGATLIVFDAMTGTIKWTRFFPGKNVRILSIKKNTLLIAHSIGTESLDTSPSPTPLR